MKMFGLFGIMCKFYYQLKSISSLFSYSHKLELTRERLSDLLSHKILVKLWDGKEYCTARTKLDKPRIGRALPTLLSSMENKNIYFHTHFI
jgi:hypothetical protein